MDQNICRTDNAQHVDVHGLQQYFRKNNSNLLQAEINGRTLIWTYPAADAHAAERAGWMLRRMNVQKIIHAQKVCLRPRLKISQEAMVITLLPAGDQIICDLITLDRLKCTQLIDDSLKSFQSSLYT